jgi:hypothetical protein
LLLILPLSPPPHITPITTPASNQRAHTEAVGLDSRMRAIPLFHQSRNVASH